MNTSRSAWRNRQKLQPLLGEDIARTAVKPRLGAGLLLFAARLRQIAKHAVRHQAQLVVVVKDHAAVAGHAEILEQEVAGKHVARGKIAQCVAVVDDGGLGGGRFGLAQKQIERPQAPLDVAVLDDQILTLDAAALARLAQQLVGEQPA